MWGTDLGKSWKELKEALSNPYVVLFPIRGPLKSLISD